MRDIYESDIVPGSTPLPVEIVETDVDLYYHIALSLYFEIEKNDAAGRESVFILPVGPVYQYRRFVHLCRLCPLDLSRLHCFFMDEYLEEQGRCIDPDHPLSFRGFIRRELLDPMPEEMNLKPDRVLFPDPAQPQTYDRRLAELGGADTCFAGVGINGHLAFNEPPEESGWAAGGGSSAARSTAGGTAALPGLTDEQFKALPTRVVDLTRETVAINSNTALRGAFERVPRRAVTVGFKQIFESKKIRVYLNRPWQSSVVRKLLFGEKSARFPASLLRDHPDVRLVMTPEVAARPEFQLK